MEIGQDRFIFVFDLDNTLVETNKSNNLAYIEAVKKVLGIDLKIKKKRFTREDLYLRIPGISKEKFHEIVMQKELLYGNYIKETTLNIELVKILNTIKGLGCKTVLLTESHKNKALQVCSHYSLNSYFDKLYFKEDYGGDNKYEFLSKIISSDSEIVLFENEMNEISKAKEIMHKSQIITVKF